MGLRQQLRNALHRYPRTVSSVSDVPSTGLAGNDSSSSLGNSEPLDITEDYWNTEDPDTIPTAWRLTVEPSRQSTEASTPGVDFFALAAQRALSSLNSDSANLLPDYANCSRRNDVASQTLAQSSRLLSSAMGDGTGTASSLAAHPSSASDDSVIPMIVTIEGLRSFVELSVQAIPSASTTNGRTGDATSSSKAVSARVYPLDNPKKKPGYYETLKWTYTDKSSWSPPAPNFVIQDSRDAYHHAMITGETSERQQS